MPTFAKLFKFRFKLYININYPADLILQASLEGPRGHKVLSNLLISMLQTLGQELRDKVIITFSVKNRGKCVMFRPRTVSNLARVNNDYKQIESGIIHLIHPKIVLLKEMSHVFVCMRS